MLRPEEQLGSKKDVNHYDSDAGSQGIFGSSWTKSWGTCAASINK